MKRLSFYLSGFLLLNGAMFIHGDNFGLKSNILFASSAFAQQPLVSGQRVRVKKLARDMGNVRGSIVTTGPSQFQNAEIVAKRSKRMKQFAEALKRYPQVNDPDVKLARAEYKTLSAALSAEFKRAKAQIEKIGNVQKSLALIEANGRKYAVPKPLSAPFSEEDAKAWVTASSNARTVSEHNLKQLAAIAPIAYLPKNRGTVQSGAPYDSDDVKRLTRWNKKMSGAVQGGYQTIAGSLKSRMQQASNALGSRWQGDPKSDKDRWTYIGQGKAEEAAEFFEENLKIANSSLYLERALKRDAKTAEALIQAVNTAKANFVSNAKIALSSSALPKPKSKDKKMKKYAKQILEIPRYKFGEFGPIVLTTPKITEHERKDSEFKIEDAEFMLDDTVKLKGTKTTWTYKWEEFRFATPLRDKEDGNWYIWWITARNYSSGSSITPIGTWVSGKATKGDQILQKNF